MEQFALLRQKALEGEQANAAVLTSVSHPRSDPDQHNGDESVWDLTATEARKLYTPAAQSYDNPGTNDDERSYFNSVNSNKRGDNALAEHIEQRSAKLAKRARTRNSEPAELGGVPISEQNAKFRDQL